MSYPLFSLVIGFVAGLMALALQSDLPEVSYQWVGLHSIAPIVGAAGSVLMLCWAQRTVVRNTALLPLCFAAGCSLGYGIILLESAYNKKLQVPLACQGVEVTGQFTVDEMAFAPDGQWVATLRNLDSHSEKTASILAHGTDACLAKNSHIQVRIAQDQGWVPGQRVVATLSLKAPWGKLQLEGFDVERWWFANGTHGMANLKYWQSAEHQAYGGLERLRFHIGQYIAESLAGHQSQGLVLALVTGDQGLVDADTRQFFSEAGLAHLVAISGLHITMLAVVFGAFFTRCWKCSSRLCRWQPAGKVGPVFGIGFALIYAVLAGWGIPAQRTLIMLVLWYLSKWQGANTSPWNVWLTALLSVLLLSPWSIFDAGLLLSFGAVGLLIWSTHGVVWVRPSIWQPLKLSVWTQYVCTVGLIPISATLFQFQSWISPVTNAFAIVWMSFVTTPLAIAGALASQAWMLGLAADSLAFQSAMLTPLINWLGSGMAVAGWPWWLVGLSLAAGLWLTKPGATWRLVPAAMMAYCLWWKPPALPHGQAAITFHDVGQGTAISVRTQSHLLVYDTGAAYTAASDTGRRVLEPFLRHHGVNRINQLWLSHDDKDHTGGAPYLLSRFKVDHLITSFNPQHVLAQAQTTATGQPNQANCHNAKPWVWDGVTFTPIPTLDKAVHKDTTKAKTTVKFEAYISDNNRSCVLKISTGAHSVLLAGDIENDAETVLVNHHAHEVRAQWLAAPHHGSKTSSSPRFLQAVNPQFVIIQAGFRNAYRHPHPEILQRYQQLGATVFNTSHDGALQMTLGGDIAHHSINLARESRQGIWRLHDIGANWSE